MSDSNKDGIYCDVLWLVALAAIWGSSFAAIKIAVTTMPPMTMVAVRTLIAVAILCPIMVLSRSRIPTDKKSWQIGMVLGVFGIALPFFLISWGELRVQSGLAAILMAVMPLTTIILAHFFNKGDRFTYTRLVGVIIGFCGIIVLVGPEALKGFGGAVFSQLAIAVAAVCYAINAVLTRNLPNGGQLGSMIGRAFMVMICGAAITIPLALIMDGPTAYLQADADGWLATIYLGILPTGLATLIYFHLVEVRGASFFSFVNYLNPVFGVFWGALLLSEQVSLQAIAALLLILSGIAVANLKR